LTPFLDYHALAPEIVLTVGLCLVLLVDLFVGEDRKVLVTNLAGLAVLASLVPVLSLAVDGADRAMFGGAYVVDNFALLLKALFLVVGYVTILMSINYLEEGDYYEGEFSFLLLSSLLGMTVMASARDLLSIFVALELLSIPAYLLAGWRKRDLRSNEASLKYYLLGVLASGIMLYGMSLIFGVVGSTNLYEIGDVLGSSFGRLPLVTVGIFLVIVGFAFKVSAVPFHFWAPDTYQGAPTPVTAFLSVASKAAGFVALIQLVFIGFLGREDVWVPLFWALAALTMTVGNLVALRQTNIVRMLAYSSVAQAGYILVPFAVAGESAAALGTAQSASITYLAIYAAMNLGAFAMVIAIARRTGSGEIGSFSGLFRYSPGLALIMGLFMFSLAGIPPLGGWFAKFVVFRSVIEAGTMPAIVLGVIAAVNSVIALFYYASIAREMWFNDAPAEVDSKSKVRVPASLSAAVGITLVITLALGVYPQAIARLGDLAVLVR
jgi:NADH-quinone oxidoreductase subunit N